MIYKLLLPSCITVCSLGTALSHADSYQFELSAVYSQSESDFSEEDYSYDLTSKEISYEFKALLSPIGLEKGPFAEAEFLNKASFLAVKANRETDEFDIDYTGIFSSLSGRFKNVTKSYNVDASFVADQGLILEAGYTKTESSNEDDFYFGLGTYLSDTASLSLSYAVYEDEEGDDYVTSVEYRSLHRLVAQSAFSIHARADYFDGDDGSGENIVGLVRYYFNRSYSVGSLFGYIDYDEDDSFYGGVQTEYFLNSKISAQVRYLVYNNDYDQDIAQVGIAARF